MPLRVNVRSFSEGLLVFADGKRMNAAMKRLLVEGPRDHAVRATMCCRSALFMRAVCFISAPLPTPFCSVAAPLWPSLVVTDCLCFLAIACDCQISSDRLLVLSRARRRMTIVGVGPCDFTTNSPFLRVFSRHIRGDFTRSSPFCLCFLGLF